jgi:predicted transposase YbfD/YdcC
MAITSAAAPVMAATQATKHFCNSCAPRLARIVPSCHGWACRRRIYWLSGQRRFPGELRLPEARTIIRLQSRTELKDHCRFEKRYFISSAPLTAVRAAHALRGHWLIENALHWTLDVVFKDDLSRLRKGHGAQNMAIVRHFAINLVRIVGDKRSINDDARTPPGTPTTSPQSSVNSVVNPDSEP